ncbi:MAG: hypothetical protein KME11_04940 [Timaviella obliquedivisa GSE-PSE-MK23-08B]|jgi:hypothetical protein|nr:hypothetical protein [Timaviella obliquedivisa GSE-PSE-MK23-08B]
MPVQEAVRVFGARQGQPGVRVIERAGSNALSAPKFGCTQMTGVMKRAPMGVMLPFTSKSNYQEVCGDPRDPNWHLFADGSHLMPDAIEGFYATGGGAGQLWLIRVELPHARKAEIMLKNALGADALRITAANEGRWGGRKNKLGDRPVIYATATTFTLIAPNTWANEFVGAEVEFTNGSGKRYQVIANTEAAEVSGEVVFTIASQYSLVADGVSGPTTLSGTGSYERYADLTGTATFALFKNVSGTVTVTDRVITGVGTQFSTQLVVGSNVYVNGEARVVDSITSNTTATVSEAFSDSGAVTLQIDNLEVIGTGTQFLNELAIGDAIYTMVGGDRQSRVVTAITDATHLTLASGFTIALTAAILEVDNLLVEGTDTLFTAELQAGAYIVDPARAGEAVKVVEVVSTTSVKLEKPFRHDFTDAQLTKQSLSAMIELSQVGNEGLSIEVGQGTKYPLTHFSLSVRFNGSQVYQVPDASLDPSDPLFVEPLVNDDGNNIAYRTGSQNYQRWITADAVWDSAYTTSAGADVRPSNGSGVIVALSDRRLYSVGEFKHLDTVGKLLYPSPYEVARSYLRVTGAAEPLTLEGTISSAGVTVTGTNSNFRSVLKKGDYLYDPVSKTARKVRVVVTDTQVTLETAFPSNVPALTKAVKAGYMEVGQGYNLLGMTQVNKRFLVSFPQFLERGYDGNLAGLIPYNFTRYADLDNNVIEGALWGKNLGLVKLALPGISDVVVQKAFTTYAVENAYEFRGEIPSNYTSASTAEVFVNQYLGRSDSLSVAFPSYGFISSPLGNGDRLISLTGEILGGEANYASIAEGYHVPFAGVSAKMSRVIKLPVELKAQDEALLNMTGIQSIKVMFGNSVVFGARSPSLSPLYEFIHIRRIQSNYVRVFLEAKELLEQIFRPNQPDRLDQIIMILNNFAEQEYNRGVFSRYLTFRQAVEIQGSLPRGAVTQDGSIGLVDIINGKLHIYMKYIPTGIVEELGINLSPDILVSQYGNSLAGSLL